MIDQSRFRCGRSRFLGVKMVSKDGGDVVAGTRLVWNQIGQSFSAPDRLHLRPYRAGIYVLAIAGSGAVVPNSAAS